MSNDWENSRCLPEVISITVDQTPNADPNKKPQ